MGELLDHALYLVRDHLTVYLKIMLIILPFTIASALALEFIAPAMSGITSPAEISPFAMFGEIMSINLINIAYGLTLVFLAPMTDGAMIHYSSSAYLGNPADLKTSFRFARANYLRMLGLHLLFYGIYFTAGCACFIVAILLQLFFFIAEPVLLLESQPVMGAITRSYELTKKHLAKLFLLLIILGMLQLFSVTFVMLQIPYLSNLLGSIAGLLYLCFTTLISVVVYFSLRSQQEQLDLELLIQTAETPAQPEPML